MAKIHAKAFKHIRGCKVTCCCDVDLKKSREFAKEFDIENYYGDVVDLISREDIQAAIVATPNSTHMQIIEALLDKDLAILCEKPLSNNYESANLLAQKATDKQIVSMVNFIHRGSAELQKASELIREGAIGKVMHIEASYLQSWLTSEYWGDWKTTEAFLWRLTEGKGVVTDIGPVLLDMVSYVAGDIKSLRTDTRSFNKGVRGNKLQGQSMIDSTDSAVMSADFANGAMGAIHMTRWATGQMNSLRMRVYGDAGGLTLDIEDQTARLQICSGEDRHKAKWRKVKCTKVPSTWQTFIDAIKTKNTDVTPNFKNAANLHKLIETSL
jgi:predicted dehydrogenase